MEQQNNSKIWILSIKWATQDAEDENISAYSSEEKAKKAFREAVKTCKELDCSEMFNEDGADAEGYESEFIPDEYFRVCESGFGLSNYEEITVYELDVQ